MNERYTKAHAASALRAFFLENCPRRYLRGNVADVFRHDEDCRHVHVSWEAGWGVSVSLSWGIDQEPAISWSSTHRSITAAVAAVALYRDVIEFAAQLETKRLEELGYVRQSDKAFGKAGKPA